MSGRFTFTAGNTLTAAQLNTNVMDGIPYKIVAGQVTVTGNLAVTFASSFTTGVNPIITATALSASGTAGTAVTYGNISNTGVTLYVWSGTSASSTARAVSWMALQMTSTTANGNS
jgi:hypothetical protein